MCNKDKATLPHTSDVHLRFAPLQRPHPTLRAHRRYRFRFSPSSGTRTSHTTMEAILDFDKDLDIGLLDRVVAAMYTVPARTRGWLSRR